MVDALEDQEVDVAALTQTVMPAGYCLRLTVGGSVDIGIGNDGRPQRSPQGPGKNPGPFSITILQDSAHPAELMLPVIGTVPAPFDGRPKG